jgi:hypothetical protein
MPFCVDQQLLVKARRILTNRSKVYWIIGGSGAGKSTVCREIAAAYGIPIYDMDAHVFDDYPQRCTGERHPALSAWFSAPDPFAWMLGLPENDFVDFNRAANAEFLDLLADDLAGTAPDQSLVIDGWITHPSLVVQVAPPGQIVCLEIAASTSAKAWEEHPDRRFMKEMVWRLPHPEQAWKRFLHTDALMTRTILDESRANGIRICHRDESTPVSATVAEVVTHLGIGPTTLA